MNIKEDLTDVLLRSELHTARSRVTHSPALNVALLSLIAELSETVPEMVVEMLPIITALTFSMDHDVQLAATVAAKNICSHIKTFETVMEENPLPSIISSTKKTYVTNKILQNKKFRTVSNVSSSLVPDLTLFPTFLHALPPYSLNVLPLGSRFSRIFPNDSGVLPAAIKYGNGFKPISLMRLRRWEESLEGFTIGFIYGAIRTRIKLGLEGENFAGGVLTKSLGKRLRAYGRGGVMCGLGVWVFGYIYEPFKDKFNSRILKEDGLGKDYQDIIRRHCEEIKRREDGTAERRKEYPRLNVETELEERLAEKYDNRWMMKSAYLNIAQGWIAVSVMSMISRIAWAPALIVMLRKEAGEVAEDAKNIFEEYY
ncbi:hypothetical protein TrVE_jg3020 [Triparma verrucosa]|uniref:Uncharacterized protein n=1 Tax=Triparma verrucosa TaxID=1606542 RepID=A0A9W7FJV6_9STRA|nr:hypothetical protein TrVE_jg3020 [Triparma verrucosa]